VTFIDVNYREEKEKRKQAAKEEAERLAQRMKELKEEEKRQKAEEAARQREEAERLSKEKQKIAMELQMMIREDFDAIVPEIVKEEVVEEPNIVSVIEEPPPVIIIEQEAPPTAESGTRTKTSGVKKLKILMQNLAACKSGNSAHPRKGPEKKYFMPQMFGHDIRFDPFRSAPTNESGEIVESNTLETDDDDCDPNNDFSDISKALSTHRIQVEKNKLKQLYQVAKSDVPPSEWTPMVRMDAIDWNYYFEEQYDLIRDKTTFNEALGHDSLEMSRSQRLWTPTSRESKPSDSLISRRVDQNTTYMTMNDESSFSFNQDIVPLPFGKVLTNSIVAGYDQFYQVIVVFNIIFLLS
jgi:hypothetical protein